MQDDSFSRTTEMWEDNLPPGSCRKIGPCIKGHCLKICMFFSGGFGCRILLEILGCWSIYKLWIWSNDLPIFNAYLYIAMRNWFALCKRKTMNQQRRNFLEHMSLKLVGKEYTRPWYQRRETRLLILNLDYKVFYSTLNRERDRKNHFRWACLYFFV